MEQPNCKSPSSIMSDSDPDRTQYRDNTSFFTVADTDSNPEDPGDLAVFESPLLAPDVSREWILGGSGPEAYFLTDWDNFNLREDQNRPADDLRRQAVDNARRRLELPDERTHDIAFMADQDQPAGGVNPPPVPNLEDMEPVGVPEVPPRGLGGIPFDPAQPPVFQPPAGGAGGGGVGPPVGGADGGGVRRREPPVVPAPAQNARVIHPVDYLNDRQQRNTQAIANLTEGVERSLNLLMAGFAESDRQQRQQYRQQEQFYRQQQQFQQQQQEWARRENANGNRGNRNGFGPPPAPQQGAHRPPKIDSSTFPALNLPAKQSEQFDTHQLWCRQVRNIIMANPAMQAMPQQSLMAGILAALRGKAAIMCQHMTGETYLNVDALLTAIGNVTCGGAAQDKASNLFFKRYQGDDEDISQFAASLAMLFHRAYEPDQRAHHVYRRQFLIGLKDREVVRLIIEREPPVEPNIEALRNAAVTLFEKLTLRKQSEQQHREIRRGIVNPQGRSTAPARSQVEPMDVSSADKSKSKSKNKGKQGHVANANANAANKGNKSKSKNGSQPQKASGSGGNQNKPKGVCYTCGSKDHYADKCPQKRGRGVNAAAAPEAEVVDEDTWQADDGQAAACVGPLQLNLSNLNL